MSSHGILNEFEVRSEGERERERDQRKKKKETRLENCNVGTGTRSFSLFFVVPYLYAYECHTFSSRILCPPFE
jgi:hypothetical protein